MSKVPYSFKGGKIVLPNRTVSVLYARIASLLVRFLSLVLIVMALIRVFMARDWKGAIYLPIAVGCFGIGQLYAKMAQQAAAAEKSAAAADAGEKAADDMSDPDKEEEPLT